VHVTRCRGFLVHPSHIGSLNGNFRRSFKTEPPLRCGITYR
jgi:hypothetical protein